MDSFNSHGSVIKLDIITNSNNEKSNTMELSKIKIQNIATRLSRTEKQNAHGIKYIVIFLSFALFLSTYAKEPRKIKIGEASFCCIFQHYTKTMDMADSLVVDSTLAILKVGEGVSKFGDFSSY